MAGGCCWRGVFVATVNPLPRIGYLNGAQRESGCKTPAPPEAWRFVRDKGEMGVSV